MKIAWKWKLSLIKEQKDIRNHNTQCDGAYESPFTTSNGNCFFVCRPIIKAIHAILSIRSEWKLNEMKHKYTQLYVYKCFTQTLSMENSIHSIIISSIYFPITSIRFIKSNEIIQNDLKHFSYCRFAHRALQRSVECQVCLCWNWTEASSGETFWRYASKV